MLGSYILSIKCVGAPTNSGHHNSRTTVQRSLCTNQHECDMTTYSVPKSKNNGIAHTSRVISPNDNLLNDIQNSTDDNNIQHVNDNPLNTSIIMPPNDNNVNNPILTKDIINNYNDSNTSAQNSSIHQDIDLLSKDNDKNEKDGSMIFTIVSNTQSSHNTSHNTYKLNKIDDNFADDKLSSSLENYNILMNKNEDNTLTASITDLSNRTILTDIPVITGKKNGQEIPKSLVITTKDIEKLKKPKSTAMTSILMSGGCGIIVALGHNTIMNINSKDEPELNTSDEIFDEIDRETTELNKNDAIHNKNSVAAIPGEQDSNTTTEPIKKSYDNQNNLSTIPEESEVDISVDTINKP